jgi:hypothetical protein
MISAHNPDADVVFIFGIMQRSGTNYLYDLLCQHPNCGAAIPGLEDFILSESIPLTKYVEAVCNAWNPRWAGELRPDVEQTMLQHLGQGILSFLISTTHDQWLRKPWPGIENARHAIKTTPLRVITKTPSVANLQLFSTIFPNSKGLVIVRDGRSVVESSLKTWSGDFNFFCQQWADAANLILDIIPRNSNLKLVKYEQLILDLDAMMKELFTFIGIDPDIFSYQAARETPIRGSSVNHKSDVGENWKPQQDKVSFKPLERFKDWDLAKHCRFNEIAGKQLSALGYEPVTS